MEKREYKCTIATKEALVKAIVQLSQEKGYEKVTIRDICRKAGISIGSFYHHFSSKEELATEAYYHIDKLIIENFTKICETKSPEENLYCILESYLKYIEDEIGMLIKTYYNLILKENSISAFAPDRLYFKKLQQVLTECVKDGYLQEPDNFTELTEYCIRFQRGLIFDWSLHNGNYSLVDQFENDFKRFINGLQKEKE